MSFIRATRSRTRCSCGMKVRGHVGVYFTNGPAVRDARLGGVADRMADPGVRDAGHQIDGVVESARARAAPQRLRAISVLMPS